jgi:phenylalanyl-tRNA synthetase beta chain
MKVSLKWLKDYVDIAVSPEKLADLLTMSGQEVEKIERVGNDTVFELEVTPNRPDCLNTIGLAREISAILNKPLKLPPASKPKHIKNKCPIEIQDKEGCRRYIGVVIENVNVGESPLWLKERILALGLRPVNNIVDITNFCLMESGQPLHAFDYDKLQRKKIVVRRAKNDEKIVIIDGAEIKCDSSVLVITDGSNPVAIAGIMGGKNTEVTEQTRNILLESAYFDPILIRRAARKLGLSSDSSYRFERGVTHDGVERTSQRACDLILKLAGGKVTKRSDVLAARSPIDKRLLTIGINEINGYLGSSLKIQDCERILKKLGFGVSKAKKEVFRVVPPAFRLDIKLNVDIIEEIGRVIGYNNLPVSLPAITMQNVPGLSRRRIRKTLNDILTSQGLSEMISYTMLDEKSLQKTGLNNVSPVSRIKNPLTSEQALMRPAILPSLFQVVLNNFNQGQKDLKLFEIGKVYEAGHEREVLGLIFTGQSSALWRDPQKRTLDIYDLKGVLETVFQKLGMDEAAFEDNDSSVFEKGVCAEVKIKGRSLGYIGEISTDVLDQWDIKAKSVLAGIIDLEAVYEQTSLVKSFEPISVYPAVVRDISLAVKSGVSFGQIKAIASRLGGRLLSSIRFNEEYVGEKIQPGYRGMIFSLVYQSSERTLREEEVQHVHNQICQAIVSELEATMR